MDVVNHSVQGFLLGYAVTDNLYVGIASGVLSLVPDLYGEFKAINGDWSWYDNVHDGKHWLKYFPPILLHIALDKLGHKESGRWYSGIWYEYFLPWRYKEAMWLEITTWLFNILLIIKLFVL